MSTVKVGGKQQNEKLFNESVFQGRLQMEGLGRELFKLAQTRNTSCPTLEIDPRWPCLPLAAYGCDGCGSFQLSMRCVQ